MNISDKIDLINAIKSSQYLNSKWVYKNIFNINKTEIRRYKLKQIFNDNSGFR